MPALALAVALSVALADPAADACTPEAVPAWIESVRNGGKEQAYLCLADTPDADLALMTFLKTADSETKGARRVQRALALHVMQRLDQPADIAALRMLNADDLRFLRDAVHARRGRQSPIPAHHEVFSKFDWYAPSPSFRSNKLTELDRANLKVIDKPPRTATSTPAEASAADAMPDATPSAPTAEASTGCGCTSLTAAPAAAGLGLALLWTTGRRRASTT